MSRIDGHTLRIQGCHEVNPRSENHRFGPCVRVGDRGRGRLHFHCVDFGWYGCAQSVWRLSSDLVPAYDESKPEISNQMEERRMMHKGKATILGYFGLDPPKRGSDLVGNKLVSVQTLHVESCTDRYSSQIKNDYFTEMWSGSKGGSYFKAHRLVYHSTLGWRVIKNKKKWRGGVEMLAECGCVCAGGSC